jgi:RNAse (barnase) inhibitor barstar
MDRHHTEIISGLDDGKQFKYFKEFQTYLSIEEQELSYYIAPLKFLNSIIENKGHKRTSDIDEYAINTLQNSLHELLYVFLNGGPSFKSNVFFPFTHGVSQYLCEKTVKLLPLVEFIHSLGHDFGKSIIELKKIRNAPTAYNFARIVSFLYRDLFEDVTKSRRAKKKAIKKRKCKKFDIASFSKRDRNYVKPLEELRKFGERYLSEHSLGFYLHGSMSTRDYVRGWSDVDTLIIVKNTTLNDPKKLLELRKKLYQSTAYFYMIDILQHHGHFILTEYDMGYYPQTYFPLVLFDFSKSFFKDCYKTFYLRDDYVERINSLWNVVRYFREKDLSKKKFDNLYEKKLFLHNILLFPTIYLQAKGFHTYKKYSFEKARKDFDGELWNVVDKASYIRSNWALSKRVPTIFKWVMLQNPFIMPFIYKKYQNLRNGFRVTEGKFKHEEIVSESFYLAENAWDKILSSL